VSDRPDNHPPGGHSLHEPDHHPRPRGPSPDLEAGRNDGHIHALAGVWLDTDTSFTFNRHRGLPQALARVDELDARLALEIFADQQRAFREADPDLLTAWRWLTGGNDGAGFDHLTSQGFMNSSFRLPFRLPAPARRKLFRKHSHGLCILLFLVPIRGLIGWV